MYNTLVKLTLFGLILWKASGHRYYTNQWAVQIEGGERVARDTAEKHGFVYAGQIMKDFYHFHHRRVAKRSTDPSPSHHKTLSQESHVKWLEQQVAKRRKKRDFLPDPDSTANNDSHNQHGRHKRDRNLFNDPKWPSMWYLKRGRGMDMNVIPAWRNGYTGRGVVVSILDDGIEKNHPDLSKNYDPQASYDVNENDADPQPRYDTNNENKHGTRCAGEVAAQANNNICSVGVAYEARIGGVRMLDGDVTDAVEAHSLSFEPQHIDIYSASWGPDDDGRTVDGPAVLARKAFYDGITKGRQGKGSIFVWASGNGGREDDNCNCDGYTNSIYTLSISSSTENGNVPWYSEQCSSTLATTYSSGSQGEKQIVTTDLRQRCTDSHTGTSASAPLAAGICALALQANPNLTWRDMQHIVVKTARPANLMASDWVTNGVGRKVSHTFGYGLMDAAAMTEVARNWTTVPPQHECSVRFRERGRSIPVNGKISFTINTDGCKRTKNHVAYLEHVQAKITLYSSRRGELSIYLVSPKRTRSTLLAWRSKDMSHSGFNDWAFMTTHNWGEPAEGLWTLEIMNGGSASELHEWTLITYGTSTHPESSGTYTTYPGYMVNTNCSGISAGNVCLDCKDNWRLLDKTCYEKCPPGFYESSLNLTKNETESPLATCQPCASPCFSCNPSNSSACKSCNNGFEWRYPTNCDFVDSDYLINQRKLMIMYISFGILSLILLTVIICSVVKARNSKKCCFNQKLKTSRETRVHFSGKDVEIQKEAGVSLLSSGDESDLMDSDSPRL